MRKILYVLPHLDYSGATRLACLTAAGLPRADFQVQVCAMGASGPLASQLQDFRVPCSVCGSSRFLDARPAFRLRQWLHAFRPDMIHAWGGRRSLAWVRLALATLPRRLRPCLLLNWSPDLPCAGPWAAWLRSADRYLAGNSFEIGAWRRLGIPASRIREAVPGIPLADGPEAATDHLATPARYVACVGPVEPHKGFLTAIWALDILRYVYPDLHLVIVGSGSDVPRLQHFARSIGAHRYLHILGKVSGVRAVLRRAEAVWIPTLTTGGVLGALEGMAEGRPLIASCRPGLEDVVVDGETAFLTRPGDAVALARQSRWLLEDAELGHRMGRSARERVRRSFTAEHLVARMIQVYNLSA